MSFSHLFIDLPYLQRMKPIMVKLNQFEEKDIADAFKPDGTIDHLTGKPFERHYIHHKYRLWVEQHITSNKSNSKQGVTPKKHDIVSFLWQCDLGNVSRLFHSAACGADYLEHDFYIFGQCEKKTAEFFKYIASSMSDFFCMQVWGDQWSLKAMAYYGGFEYLYMELTNSLKGLPKEMLTLISQYAGEEAAKGSIDFFYNYLDGADQTKLVKQYNDLYKPNMSHIIIHGSV